MTEEQAIKRIRQAIDSEFDLFYDTPLTDQIADALAQAVWNEMKAISAELAEKHGTSPKVFIDAQLDALQ